MADRAINRIIEDWNQKIAGLTLQEWAKRLYGETGEEAFEVDNPGTIMKLLLLWNYMLFPYLHIMASQRQRQRKKNRLGKLFYFDPYAGNGIVKIRANDQIIMIPGSAILALLAPILLHEKRKTAYSYYWDVIVLNDIKEEYREALIKRCKHIIGWTPTLEHPYTITVTLSSINTSPNERYIAVTNHNCVQEDSWLTFKQSFDNVKRESGWIHGLIFFDPPSPDEMPLKHISKLLSIPSDVIALLHTGIFAENVNMRRYKPDTLTDILNCDIKTAESLLGQTHTVDELENLYLESFRKLLTSIKMDVSSGSNVRDVIKYIPLRTKRGRYHLIVATRKTGGEQFKKEWQAWFKWFNNFADEVSKLSDHDSLVVEILSGRQAILY